MEACVCVCVSVCVSLVSLFVNKSWTNLEVASVYFTTAFPTSSSSSDNTFSFISANASKICPEVNDLKEVTPWHKWAKGFHSCRLGHFAILSCAPGVFKRKMMADCLSLLSKAQAKATESLSSSERERGMSKKRPNKRQCNTCFCAPSLRKKASLEHVHSTNACRALR